MLFIQTPRTPRLEHRTSQQQVDKAAAAKAAEERLQMAIAAKSSQETVLAILREQERENQGLLRGRSSWYVQGCASRAYMHGLHAHLVNTSGFQPAYVLPPRPRIHRSVACFAGESFVLFRRKGTAGRKPLYVSNDPFGNDRCACALAFYTFFRVVCVGDFRSDYRNRTCKLHAMLFRIQKTEDSRHTCCVSKDRTSVIWYLGENHRASALQLNAETFMMTITGVSSC